MGKDELLVTKFGMAKAPTIRTIDATEVCVSTSSAVKPALWLVVKSDRGEVFAHLSLKKVKRLRRQLKALIEHREGWGDH